MAFSFFRGRRRLKVFEDAPRIYSVRFVQIKLSRAQMRSNVPLCVAKQWGQALQRFISSTQSPQHFRGTELCVSSKGRMVVCGNRPVERQRVTFAMGTGKQLRAPKIRSRILSQSRIR